ncbi:Zinc-binding alcohol dehydrogenase [Corynebacterium kutscheri]|uniref:Theronine dehydrogenase-like Zn-dependent dehydrogenase n=1 Tax=Corynebacterium kutscheri TaxID=35755 RepID=A0A0F6R227_9CORY|nr:zinc-binding dehydrogenase [Corynebacterium kutscheri]AKE42230.1 theronine dehydrogenase-like Zn-dependent dehydrogenase [Corynebacterium kutscheri]VEH05715.1 Zinc-binding alcohol dehydrogenase [Corynebacterium kutscheri]VEH10573.1 Zinc-binding alcohol dehydrogenase [Corynebacterium kutscheri]VEH81611.1 Zinc-binding alcohol dehydrogenase [Corynebacterium kutscheri]
MKAALILKKNELVVTDVPDLPSAHSNEDMVAINVSYVGICGSDLHYYYDGQVGAFELREPLIPGHEMSGYLDDGTPVTIHPATFGTCQPGLEDQPHIWPHGAYFGSASTWPHTQGAMVERILVRKDQVHVLPATLDIRRAALVEPLSVALHAITLAGNLNGKKVLVSGAGPIGQLAAAAALVKGAQQVWLSDIFDEPLERAHALGEITTVNVSTDQLPEEEFDIVLECAGVAAATTAALVAARRQATVVQVGMLPGQPVGINLAPLVAKELSLKGTFRFNDEINQSIQLLAEHELFDAVITHTFDLSEVHTAFATAKNAQLSGKVLVKVGR